MTLETRVFEIIEEVLGQEPFFKYSKNQDTNIKAHFSLLECKEFKNIIPLFQKIEEDLRALVKNKSNLTFEKLLEGPMLYSIQDERSKRNLFIHITWVQGKSMVMIIEINSYLPK